MSDPKSDQEPSMEEILASIRRIISEDDAEDGKEAQDDGPSAIEDEAEPLIAEAPAPEPAPEDDVFELTQEVRDDGSVIDINTGETIHGREAPELVEFEDIELGMPPAAPPMPRAHPSEGLVGPPADAASTASFETLAHVVAGQRAEAGIGGRTVEEVVKEVVRPIVKDWLDANLPEMVERLINREIVRMTRRAEDAADR